MFVDKALTWHKNDEEEHLHLCSTSDIKALVVACFPGSKRMRRRAEKMTTTVKNGFHLQNEAAQGSKKKSFFCVACKTTKKSEIPTSCNKESFLY